MSLLPNLIIVGAAKSGTTTLFDELKLIEENLDLQINKALNNPLSGISAKGTK